MKFLYVLYCCLVYPFMKIVCPCRVYGKKNIPDGAAIICANHTSNYDPVMMAIYSGFIKHKMHFMAKAELLEIPVLGPMLKAAGIFPVRRGENTDIESIRTAMKYLKNGEKIMMFPEGTRVTDDTYVAAKTGAVRIASKLNVPILPVRLTSGRKTFRRNIMVIGEPYYIKTPADKNYEPLAEELLKKIKDLEHKN